MDDDKLKPVLNLNIDAQKDFNPVAAAGDRLSSARIKDYLKDINLGELLKNIPAKKQNESLSHKLPPLVLDQSGSMCSILAHEIPHKVYKHEKILEKDYEPLFGKGKIIVFDEISSAGKEGLTEKFREYFNEVMAVHDSYRASQACGEQLAESFQQGTSTPVQVRRPLSLRAQAGFVA